MVRYTIPAAVLAMAIGAMGSAPALRKGSVVSDEGASAAGHQVVTDSWKDAVKNLKGGLEQNGNANGNANGNGNGNGNSRTDGSSEVDTTFATSSIEGTYAVTVTEGVDQVRGLGILNYDGSGGLSGSLTYTSQRVGSDTVFDRTLFTTDVTGSYSVNADGTGQEVWSLLDTPVGPFDYNMRLTVGGTQGSSVTKVNAVASEISDLLPGQGALAHTTMVRRTSTGFNNGSMVGPYEWVLFSNGAGGETRALGIMNFDGEGNCEGTTYIDDPGRVIGSGPGEPFRIVPDLTIRSIFESIFSGTYSVDDDGTGTFIVVGDINGPFPLSARWVITETRGANFVVGASAWIEEVAPLSEGPNRIEFTYIGN